MSIFIKPNNQLFKSQSLLKSAHDKIDISRKKNTITNSFKQSFADLLPISNRENNLKTSLLSE